MNGFIKRSAAVLCLSGVVVLGGCCCGSKETRLCDCYDNCWLERYSFQAHQSVKQSLGAQVGNGHVLDQTVFTYHFLPGTDTLTVGGQEHLMYLARRRPMPDTRIYLQTAQDVAYDPAAPDQFVSTRSELDAKRVAAIQRFLSADTAGRPLAFDVAVHDAPTAGITPIPGMIFDGRATPGAAYYNTYKPLMPLSSTSGTSGGASGGAK
jgi:hypothetical protein